MRRRTSLGAGARAAALRSRRLRWLRVLPLLGKDTCSRSSCRRACLFAGDLDRAQTAFSVPSELATVSQLLEGDLIAFHTDCCANASGGVAVGSDLLQLGPARLQVSVFAIVRGGARSIRAGRVLRDHTLPVGLHGGADAAAIAHRPLAHPARSPASWPHLRSACSSPFARRHATPDDHGARSCWLAAARWLSLSIVILATVCALRSRRMLRTRYSRRRTITEYSGCLRSRPVASLIRPGGVFLAHPVLVSAPKLRRCSGATRPRNFSCSHNSYCRCSPVRSPALLSFSVPSASACGARSRARVAGGSVRRGLRGMLPVRVAYMAGSMSSSRLPSWSTTDGVGFCSSLPCRRARGRSRRGSVRLMPMRLRPRVCGIPASPAAGITAEDRDALAAASAAQRTAVPTQRTLAQ